MGRTLVFSYDTNKTYVGNFEVAPGQGNHKRAHIQLVEAAGLNRENCVGAG